MEKNKLVYTVKEMASLLGIALPQAYDLCRKTDFPSVRISPRRIVIPVAALDAWLDRKAAEAIR